jgi:hypothetical protein
VRPSANQGSNLSFANLKGRRAVAAWLFVLAAGLAAGSFAWGWCHLTFPASPGVQAVASVGHRPVTIVFALLMILAAVRIGLMAPNPALARRLAISTRITAIVLASFVLWDLSAERSHAIAQLVTNTANQLHLRVETVRAAIDAQVARGLVRVSFAPGIAVAGLAALTCVVAGYVARAASREPVGDSTRPSPPGSTAPQPPTQTIGPAASSLPGGGLDEAALGLTRVTELPAAQVPPTLPPPPAPAD